MASLSGHVSGTRAPVGRPGRPLKLCLVPPTPPSWCLAPPRPLHVPCPTPPRHRSSFAAASQGEAPSCPTSTPVGKPSGHQQWVTLETSQNPHKAPSTPPIPATSLRTGGHPPQTPPGLTERRGCKQACTGGTAGATPPACATQPLRIKENPGSSGVSPKRPDLPLCRARYHAAPPPGSPPCPHAGQASTGPDRGPAKNSLLQALLA